MKIVRKKFEENNKIVTAVNGNDKNDKKPKRPQAAIYLNSDAKAWKYFITMKLKDDVTITCEKNPVRIRVQIEIYPIDDELTDKNIERHTAHTIVSWHNPKQWQLGNTSDSIMTR